LPFSESADDRRSEKSLARDGSLFVIRIQEAFTEALEGTSRPLDRVFADFHKYQVEINLRKFFRVVSSESSLSILEEAPVTNPEECACFLHSLFASLADQMRDHHLRALVNEYFRIAITRDVRRPRHLHRKPNPKPTLRQRKRRPLCRLALAILGSS
jgi:hypothetical protein